MLGNIAPCSWLLVLRVLYVYVCTVRIVRTESMGGAVFDPGFAISSFLPAHATSARA